MEIRDNSALEIWKKALNQVVSEGDDYVDNDGRTCREIVNLNLTLEEQQLASIEYPIDVMAESKKWIPCHQWSL